MSSGRDWSYRDGFLVNNFLGRVGHTPAWVVEVEGRLFNRPEPRGWRQRWKAWRSRPRIVQRNLRRLAFTWPLLWPPPDREARERMTATALALARRWGVPTPHGCGVCDRAWTGGPTFVRGRARHLCPECAERIAAEQAERPPGTLATWLWCLVAGASGLLLQLLFQQTWTALPIALAAGWLMGTANGPNFERHPLLSPALTAGLVLLFQAAGSTVITGSSLGHVRSDELARIFIWTLVSLPSGMLVSSVAGGLGMVMAMLERRLQRA